MAFQLTDGGLLTRPHGQRFPDRLHDRVVGSAAALGVAEHAGYPSRGELQARVAGGHAAALRGTLAGRFHHVEPLVSEGDQVLRLVDAPGTGPLGRRQRRAVDEEHPLLILARSLLRRRLVGVAQQVALGLLRGDELVEAGAAAAPDHAILGEAKALAEGAVHALFERGLVVEHLFLDRQLSQARLDRVALGLGCELLHSSLGRLPRQRGVATHGDAHRGLHLGHVRELLALENRVGLHDRVGLRSLLHDPGLEAREPGELGRIRCQRLVPELLPGLDVDPLQVVEVAPGFVDVFNLNVDVVGLELGHLLEDGVRATDAPR